MAERRRVKLPELDHQIDVFLDGPASSALAIAAAHPVEAFGAGTAALLAQTTGAKVLCFEVAFDDVAPGGAAIAPTLERMVERIDAVRRGLGIDRWIFWGMSGGGWLAQIYAHLHPGALRAVVIESACACFRERLADPDCIASPFHPAWRDRLRDAGLLSTTSHRELSSGDDAEWTEVEGVGQVFRRRGGPALMVLPGPPDARMRRAMPRLWEIDARPWLGAIRVPALVICGAADPVVPLRHARVVHDAIAGSVRSACRRSSSAVQPIRSCRCATPASCTTPSPARCGSRSRVQGTCRRPSDAPRSRPPSSASSPRRA